MSKIENVSLPIYTKVSPNPIKDLQDKGLLDPVFNNQTCLTIKQKYDKLRR
jgi:hypothetical protein